MGIVIDAVSVLSAMRRMLPPMMTPLIWPRPGVSVPVLLQALNLAHDTGGNVVGPLMDPVQSYLRWASDNVDRLRWQLDAGDVDRLIRTPFFWAAIGMDGQDPLASKLVSGEVDARRTDLQKAIQSIETFRRRLTGDDPAPLVLPDTNVLLEHPDQLEQVDWHLLARPYVRQLDQVHVLVPLLVVDELDDAKRVNRTKSRARTVLKTVYRLAAQEGAPHLHLSELPDRGAAWLDVISEVPGHHRLERADDELVRIAGQLSSLLDRPVIFATYDTGAALRASAAGVTHVHLTHKH